MTFIAFYIIDSQGHHPIFAFHGDSEEILEEQRTAYFQDEAYRAYVDKYHPEKSRTFRSLQQE